MKNLILLIFFSFLSLCLLVILITLAFLPKLCVCFHSFFNKNYKIIKKQNTRARRIKRARLRLLYKSQVNHETPMQKELDRSAGVFFDEEQQRKIKDEVSLARYRASRFDEDKAPGLLRICESFFTLVFLQKIRYGLLTIHNSVKAVGFHAMIYSRGYLTQFRNFLSSSVSKYLNH